MLSPKLYKNSRTYDFFMKLLGYESSIDRFLAGLQLDCKSDVRILDVGCGTGFIGLHFLERYPAASLQATDIEPNFLRATLVNARKRGISEQRIATGVADISDPRQISRLGGGSDVLPNWSFDLICVGAVVGYADDTEASIRQLIGLLAPGGCLLNLEMNESLTGRFVSHRYHYENISIQRMCQVISEEGCEVTNTKLSLRHLPAKLTRTAIVAHKSDP